MHRGAISHLDAVRPVFLDGNDDLPAALVESHGDFPVRLVERDNGAHESILDVQRAVLLREHDAFVLVNPLAREREKPFPQLPGVEPYLLAEAINRPYFAI